MTEEANTVYDLIVVGSGPAGLAAAIHSAVFELHTLILEAGETGGGSANKARGIGNYPGFKTKISGQRLMERMVRQTVKNGVELHTSEEVVKISLHGGDRVVETPQGKYACRALILATGDGMKGIGIKWETWLGSGVCYCAECGAPFLRGKHVIIVGNVDDAVDEALRLAETARNVRLVNHANLINISERARKRLEEKRVSLIENFVGREIKGKPPSKKLVLQRLNATSTMTLKADMVFVVGGVKPFVTVLRNAGIRTHRQGCIVVDDFGKTSVEGVFATGGCASTVKDIIPACVGDGASVATCARLYLAYGTQPS